MTTKQPSEAPVTHSDLREIYAELSDGKARMSMLEQSISENTAETRRIADNTQGFVSLLTELETGTRFLCRCALAVRFILKDIIEPFWKPALLCFVAYNIFFNHDLPEWVKLIFKQIG